MNEQSLNWLLIYRLMYPSYRFYSLTKRFRIFASLLD